ncbi:MAG: hypothetical protein HZB38_15900 [Planctomycetes bacterium]|nr:hypothetical protein [Planctomycetota bacterium]
MDKEILIAVISGFATLGAAIIGYVAVAKRAGHTDDLRGGAADSPGAAVPDLRHDLRDRIREALARLVERAGDDSFVIFEDARTRKFVQFTGDAEGVLLDLPVQELSEVERERATAYFAAHDVRLMETKTFSSFQLDFGDDLDQAAETALTLFQHVFRLGSEFDLRIEEN